ncbi:MAG: adenylate cyclase [Phycisphaerae bacterium]|nr:adenylate cyclase [Phycisphaerae bacterium]
MSGHANDSLNEHRDGHATDHTCGHLEIERAWLLRGEPAMPASRWSIQIEQGYLLGDGGLLRGARLRRAVDPAGAVHCTMTRKSGKGLVRQEHERTLDAGSFEELWPHTSGRRLRKVRHVVPHGSLKWEIDGFIGLDLWLAEVELPSVDTVVEPPPWLAPWILREVTEDPRYRNSALALRGLPQ